MNLLPRIKLAETGQYVCPGSIFIPTSDGRCICGLPRESHVWEHAGGAGVFRRIDEADSTLPG